MLSGHTHGGQIFPLQLLCWLSNPYFAGLYTVPDPSPILLTESSSPSVPPAQRQVHTQIYVGRGSSYWGPPMRLLAPAEVTEITLRSTMK